MSLVLEYAKARLGDTVIVLRYNGKLSWNVITSDNVVRADLDLILQTASNIENAIRKLKTYAEYCELINSIISA